MLYLPAIITHHAYGAFLCLLFLVLSSNTFGKSVTLRWEIVEDSVSYEIEILKDGKPFHTKIVPASRRKLKKDLPPGEYAFQVRAIDSEGEKGEWADTKTFFIPQDPPKEAAKESERNPAAVESTSTEMVTPTNDSSTREWLALDLGVTPASYEYGVGNSSTSFNASSRMVTLTYALVAGVRFGLFRATLDVSDLIVSLNHTRHNLWGYGLAVEYELHLSRTLSVIPLLGLGSEDVLEAKGASNTGNFTLTKLSYAATRLGITIKATPSPRYSFRVSALAWQPFGFTGLRGDRSFSTDNNLANYRFELSGEYFFTPSFASRLSGGYRRDHLHYQNGANNSDDIKSFRYFAGLGMVFYFY